MAENSRTVRSLQASVPQSFQESIHHNSHYMATSATQRIHDLHHYVIRGLSPLINTSTLRSIRHPHSGVTWSRHRMDIAMEQYSPSMSDSLHTNDAREQHVIEIEDAGHHVQLSDVASDSSSSNAPNDDPNTNNRTNEANSSDSTANLRSTPEYQMLISFVEKYVPFLMILLMKLVFDHRIGILVVIGLFITFFHANSVVKREVSKQAKRQITSLLMVLVNLTMCVIVIYAVLGEKDLAYALAFIAPYSSPISIWDVLWIISVTDFVLRIITVGIKLFILAIPGQLVAFQKKGKHYLFVERTSQLYRTFVPMQHWLYFFSESYTGPSKVFGVILSAAYLIFKCKGVVHKAKIWKQALIKVLQSKTYGITPSVGQIKEAGDSCPICQDDYKSPSMLQCKHIFCEECVALWFDRERTCPICRAQIADDPSWRDGSTTLMLQIF